MRTKQVWANLSVADLERTSKFYKQLGFKQNGKSNQLTTFFFGEEEFTIHFFVRYVLEPSMRGRIIDARVGNEIIFTLSVERKEQVDQLREDVMLAGGAIISEPEDCGDGFYGFVFADPDGHRFNVLHARL